MLSKIWVWDPGSEIRDPEKTYSGLRNQGKKGTGSRIQDPDPQHWWIQYWQAPVFRIRVRTVCFWASRIRIPNYLYGSRYFQQQTKNLEKPWLQFRDLPWTHDNRCPNLKLKVEKLENLIVKVWFLYLGVEDVCYESMAGVVSCEALLQPFQHLVADSNLTYER